MGARLMSKFNLEKILSQVGKETHVPEEAEKNAFVGKLLGWAGKAGKAAGKGAKAGKGAASKASKAGKKTVKNTTKKKDTKALIDTADPASTLKTVGTIAAPVAAGAIAAKVINTNTSANTSVDGTGLPDDQKSLITNPDGSKGSDNTGGFQRPDFVPPPGGNQGPKDDGSGSEVTAPSDSSKVDSGSDIIPPPSVPDTVKVVPTDNKPSSSTKTDLEDYNKKVKATQDSLEIEKRKSDYDKILNNLLQKQGSAVEESEVEETVSKADTLMSKIAQDPAYGVATPTGQSPIWTHAADSKRGKEILKSMKLDPAQYDATVSDTLFYKNDVGTGFDATHWGIPKDRTKKPKLHTETKSEAVTDQAVETMGSYIQTLKDLDGREVKDTRKK